MQPVPVAFIDDTQEFVNHVSSAFHDPDSAALYQIKTPTASQVRQLVIHVESGDTDAAVRFLCDNILGSVVGICFLDMAMTDSDKPHILEAYDHDEIEAGLDSARRISGIRLLKALTESPICAIECVVVSKADIKHVRAAALDLGAVAFIGKYEANMPFGELYRLKHKDILKRNPHCWRVDALALEVRSAASIARNRIAMRAISGHLPPNAKALTLRHLVHVKSVSWGLGLPFTRKW